MNKKIGFIGLGHMGLPMAQNLMQAGFDVTVYNRTKEKAQPLIDAGAKLAMKPYEVVEPGCTVITMLANDEAVKEIVKGKDGIAAALGKDETHISMSTVAPTTTDEIYEAHQRHNTAFIAAPVFGRPDVAAAKKLWIAVSGADKTKKEAEPILKNLGQAIYDFGETVAAANVVKLTGNFLIMSALEAIAEALTFAEKNGIDRNKIVEMFGQTMFASPIYQTYGKIIANEKFSPAGFKLPLGFKDINLVLKTAAEVNMPMPLASLLHDRFISAIAKNRAELDWSAIALNVAEDAGIKK